MKKSLLYYSDCYFFAGCENMIANFLNSKELAEEFDVHFVYRYSARYEEGARIRIRDVSNCEGVKLITEPTMDSWVNSNNRILALFQRIVWNVVFIAAKYWCIYRNTKTLKDVFAKYRPDIVHINNGGYPAATSAQAAVFAAHKCNVRIIYYVVNNMAMSYMHATRIFDLFVDHYVKKYVTRFITGSNNAGNHLKKVLSLPEEKQITIRNGIVQRSTTMSVADFKEKYSVPEDKVVFTTIANLEERKGHKYLLYAIRELKEEGKLNNQFFVFEGKGPNEEFIMNYIVDNDLSKYVRLISVPAIYDLYAASDVVILPSIANEDFPNIIIESMGMGIPVIGTKIAGIPEQIIPDETGILIEPANVEELKAAILKMSRDEIFRSDCSKRAQKVFAENYTSVISVMNYIDLYRE